MRRPVLTLALALGLLVATPAPAVTITIVNKDAAGKGLNDPTPATPVGGNPGTTIGQQRMNVFRKAAEMWGQTLPGSIEIKVDASFSEDPAVMPCSATSAVLGSSGPVTIDTVANAPEPDLWYVGALANQIAGYDLDPGYSSIESTFNARLGQTGCLTGRYFYYGFDTNQSSSSINFLVTALHEFAHGLGFVSLADESTGAWLVDNRGSIFDKYVLDTTAGKTWTQMTSNSERQASAVNTGNVVWNGAATTAAAATYLSGQPLLFVTAPPAAAGNYTVGTATFGGTITATGVSGTMVAATDALEVGGSVTDACSSPLTNASAVAGRIALVDRGSCDFTIKARNVELAGGIGIVIANNVDGAPPQMSGTDPSITIPVVSVTLADGGKLRANLPAAAKIALDPQARAGADAQGRVFIYAPNPVSPGSSISHFDRSAIPNLLMEPNISSDLPIGLDLTPALFADIGWFGSTPGGAALYYLPTSARSKGGTPTAPAYYTSDLFIANRGAGTAHYTLKFLGHDQDGTNGPEESFVLPAGQAATFRDVLGSVFGLSSDADYGAIRISADSTDLKIGSLITTPTPDRTGAFGQTVPAVPTSRLITPAAPAAIVGLREDGTARTNLVLMNATTSTIEIDLSLYRDDGAPLGVPKQESLPPLGMKQIGRVIEYMTGARNTSNATLELSTPTAGGAFTAFASVLNNVTNDPATILPRGAATGAGSATYLVPTSARSAGGTPTAPAYYTSDLFIANRGALGSSVTLKFLGHDRDGTVGPERQYPIGAGTALTFRDVLGSVFGLSSNADYGAIQITSSAPGLAIDSLITTPAPSGGGKFGQSVPGVPSGQWTQKGQSATIVGLREDGTARTNLVLVNGTTNTIEIGLALFGDDGAPLGVTKQEFLPPLGMKQIGRVIEYMTGARNTSNATLVLVTPTAGGAFTALASLLNNGTNDPASILPQ